MQGVKTEYGRLEDVARGMETVSRGPCRPIAPPPSHEVFCSDVRISYKAGQHRVYKVTRHVVDND